MLKSPNHKTAATAVYHRDGYYDILYIRKVLEAQWNLEEWKWLRNKRYAHFRNTAALITEPEKAHDVLVVSVLAAE